MRSPALRNPLAVLGLVLLLGACASPGSRDIACPQGDAWRYGTHVATADPSGLTWAVVGERTRLDHDLLLVGEAVPAKDWDPSCAYLRDSVSLRSLLDLQGGGAEHELRVSAVQESQLWAQWVAAEVEPLGDGTATEVPVRRHDRQVGACNRISLMGCEHSETFGAVLDEGMLRARADTGLAVQFHGARGDRLRVVLHPDQIFRQLAALDAARANLRAER